MSAASRRMIEAGPSASVEAWRVVMHALLEREHRSVIRAAGDGQRAPTKFDENIVIELSGTGPGAAIPPQAHPA